jgi:hypothetical protein
VTTHAPDWIETCLHALPAKADIDVAFAGGVPSGLLDIASFPPLAYRRRPDSIFRETQRYSFNLLLAFFIQLLPALLHSAYDEYPVVEDCVIIPEP